MNVSEISRLAALRPTHAHPLRLTRRQVLAASAATSAAVVASGFLAPLKAAAAAPGPGTPVPVDGDPALGGLHVWLPGPGNEPSAITDFNGAIGIAAIDGSGTGTDLATGATESLLFDTDVRFMQGVFRGTDGRIHQGTFAFL